VSRVESLLEVRGLSVAFATRRGNVTVVEDVDLDVAPGEVLGVVGESGSGKSATALALMRLLPPTARARGSVKLSGRELTTLSEKEMRLVRGREIGMIFQEPMSSLNPVYPVGFQVAEVLEEHLGLRRKESNERAVEILDLVGIPAARERARSYPHEISGGMRQRVMIAIAMACRPQILIADEPTTALDVTIQAQILSLMRDLGARFGSAILLVSHDMGVIASMADRVVVMYAGRIVEQGEVARIFSTPRHPYTRLLLSSVPRVGERQERLDAIPGTAPSPWDYPSGCRFHPRCPERFDRCDVEAPPLEDGSRCFLDNRQEQRAGAFTRTLRERSEHGPNGPTTQGGRGGGAPRH
jgi:peptide/nickel transport system ATP-binding protein